MTSALRYADYASPGGKKASDERNAGVEEVERERRDEANVGWRSRSGAPNRHRPSELRTQELDDDACQSGQSVSHHSTFELVWSNLVETAATASHLQVSLVPGPLPVVLPHVSRCPGVQTGCPDVQMYLTNVRSG